MFSLRKKHEAPYLNLHSKYSWSVYPTRLATACCRYTHTFISLILFEINKRKCNVNRSRPLHSTAVKEAVWCTRIGLEHLSALVWWAELLGYSVSGTPHVRCLPPWPVSFPPSPSWHNDPPSPTTPIDTRPLYASAWQCLCCTEWVPTTDLQPCVYSFWGLTNAVSTPWRDMFTNIATNHRWRSG